MSTVPGPKHTVMRRSALKSWECDTVKDLRCKRVKEEEYEDLDFEECYDKEESTPTEYELEYTTGIKALSMP